MTVLALTGALNKVSGRLPDLLGRQVCATLGNGSPGAHGVYGTPARRTPQ